MSYQDGPTLQRSSERREGLTSFTAASRQWLADVVVSDICEVVKFEGIVKFGGLAPLVAT